MRHKKNTASGLPNTGGSDLRRSYTMTPKRKPSSRESLPLTPTGGSYSIKKETAAMEVTKLPKDLQELVLEFHAAGPAHARMNHEFEELVAGRPWSCWTLIWYNWWGEGYGLNAPPLSRYLRAGDPVFQRITSREPPGGWN